jgi:hypothetical protein
MSTARVTSHIGKVNVRRLIAVLCFVLGVPGLTTAQTDSFDVPLKKTIVHLGPSPYYPAGKVQINLTCYIYSKFMVKEYDEGQKGAEWLSIVPFEAQTAPRCTRSHARAEKVIEEPEWGGYFGGAKSNLVFFRAADGSNGGMPFVVYDAKTGTKLFEDSLYDANMWNSKAKNSSFDSLRVRNATDGQIVLMYLRVADADCDLHREQAACWQQIRKNLEVKSSETPVCSGYANVTTRWASAVAYPVEVSLFPHPTTKTVNGPAKCWPVD